MIAPQVVDVGFGIRQVPRVLTVVVVPSTPGYMNPRVYALTVGYIYPSDYAP